MIDYKLKGMLNAHTVVSGDYTNSSNKDNTHIFGQVISGTESSEMMNYLLNMNKQRISDFKSMMIYNESNRAAIINQARVMEEVIDERTIILPNPVKKLKVNFSEILQNRRSIRSFTKLIMDKGDLSSILHYAFGFQKRKTNFDGIVNRGRFYSSGGGLYPINVYIYCNYVDTIYPGFYKYQPYSNSLYPLDINRVEKTNFFIDNMIDIENMNLALFFEYTIDKTYLKYGELSLLNVLVETGIMSHNFDLVCTAMGYRSCPIAGYDKNYLEQILNLDSVNEHIIFSNICGRE
ncbi:MULTISPECIES: SagB family peptide dehydrogenase [Heyndrickxia]|uniref:SagB family peptide dehydrogenase n=1 Tax=Heyndrickxia TaxID=2837504 RepID=UPI00037B3EF3|nr:MULTISPECIES: SagB family peptide dehydrogenase [Heyndrickxia]AWP35610.1 dehydrogenase [Heyndrickxia coagulans]MEC2304887.1 SagB family peptide dehydrogenase [Weizmannia sp. CD-2023]MEC2341506.1 SagB family peptide dehydrogenase [Weizmannia sp. CD-2023]MED4893365.1 SagB family peptide dehydrogenase [Weizmannia sp. CD-2023]MED4921394.1 SagB family peptide dehydrogenase [Weizmannia sp. CD-2023]